jgi:hypothetical protein
MARSEFIQVTIKTSDPEKSVQFVNRNHIQRIYTDDNKVYIEMTDYTVFEIDVDNIHTFMDRFVD